MVDQNQEIGLEANTDMGQAVFLMYLTSPKLLAAGPGPRTRFLLLVARGMANLVAEVQLDRKSGNVEAFFKLMVKAHRFILGGGCSLSSLSQKIDLIPN